MFVTNNASIGLHSVYHHIYNFGNTGMFFGMVVGKLSLKDTPFTRQSIGT